MLGEELSEQGYHASYVYNDAEMMEIGRDQMKLLEALLLRLWAMLRTLHRR